MFFVAYMLLLGLYTAQAFESPQMIVKGAGVATVNGYYYCHGFGDCRNEMYSLYRTSRMNGDRLQRVWYLTMLPAARGADLDPSYRFTYASIEKETNSSTEIGVIFDRWRTQETVYEENMQVSVVPLECTDQSERLQVEANVYSLLSSRNIASLGNDSVLRGCIQRLMTPLDGKSDLDAWRGMDLVPRLRLLVQTIDEREASKLLPLCAWAASLGAASVSGQCYLKARKLVDFQSSSLNAASIKLSPLSCYSLDGGNDTHARDECLQWNGLLSAAAHSLLADMSPLNALQLTSTYLLALGGAEQAAWSSSQCRSAVLGLRATASVLLYGGIVGMDQEGLRREHVEMLLREIQGQSQPAPSPTFPSSRALSAASRDILQHAGYLCLDLLGGEGGEGGLDMAQTRGLSTALLYAGGATLAADLAQAVLLRLYGLSVDGGQRHSTELCPIEEREEKEKDGGACLLLRDWLSILKSEHEHGYEYGYEYEYEDGGLLESPLVRSMMRVIRLTRRLAHIKAAPPGMSPLSLTLPLALHLASPTIHTRPLEGSADAAVAAPSEQELLRALLVLFMEESVSYCRQGLRVCHLEDPVVTVGSRGLFLLAYSGLYSADAPSLDPAEQEQEQRGAVVGGVRGATAYRNVMADSAVPALYQQLLHYTQPHWPWVYRANTTTAGGAAKTPGAGEEGKGGGLLSLLRRWRKMVRSRSRSRSRSRGRGREEEQGPPPRVGVMSAFLSSHSVGRLFGPVLAALNSSRLELHVLSLARPVTPSSSPSSSASSLTAEMRGLVTAQGGTWHDLLGNQSGGGDVPSVARDIRSLGLHVLLGLDTAMDSLTAHLLCLRLAPTVVLFWGHPFTSGYAASVDYFVSGEAFEGAEPGERSRRMHTELLYRGPLYSPETGELVVPSPSHRWVPSTALQCSAQDSVTPCSAPRAPVALREFRHRVDGFSEQLVRFESLQFLMYPLGRGLEGAGAGAGQQQEGEGSDGEEEEEEEEEERGREFERMVSRGVTVHLSPHSLHHLPACSRGAAGGQGQRHRHRHRACYRVFACQQSLMKMHPMLDRVWARLLLQDPWAVVLLQADSERHSGWVRRWLVRLRATVRQEAVARVRVQRGLTGDAGGEDSDDDDDDDDDGGGGDDWVGETEVDANGGASGDSSAALLAEAEALAAAAEARLVLLPRLPHQDYLRYLCLSDVNVDPVPFGGGVTMTDTLRCGQVHGSHTAFVTHPSLQTVHRLGGGIVAALNASISASAPALDVHSRLWRECCSDGRARCALAGGGGEGSRVIGLSVLPNRYLFSRSKDLLNPRGRRTSMSRQMRDRKRGSRRDRALRSRAAAAAAAGGKVPVPPVESGNEVGALHRHSSRAHLRRLRDERVWDYVDLASCAARASRNESSSASSQGRRGGQTGREGERGAAEELLFASLNRAKDSQHAAVQEWEHFLLAVAAPS